MRIHRPVLAGLALVLGGVACTSSSTDAGGSSTPATPAPSASPSISPSESASPSASPTEAPPQAEIEDGKHFVYVRKLDPDAPSLTFDLAEFYTGDEANQIAGERGDEVPVPNDVYIVNDNPKLRTVPVAGGARILVYDWSKCCDDYTEISVSDWGRFITHPTSEYHGKLSPYWIRVKDGRIVKVEEQYLP